MTYVLISLLALALLVTRLELRAERTRATEREDSLLNRIQAPQQAVVQSMTEQIGTLTEPAYISAFDDDALAEAEEQRRQVRSDVQRFIEENTSAEPAE